MKVNRPHWVAFGFFLIAGVFFFRGLLFSGGTLGLRDDWPIPSYPEQIVELSVKDTVYAWSDNFLGFARTRQAGNYIDWVTGSLARVGMGGPVISRYPLLLIVLAGYSMFVALRRFGRSLEASVVFGLYYMTAPVVFNSLISGYLKFFVSYALVPLFIVQLEKIVTEKKTVFADWLWLFVLFGLVATQANFLVLFFVYSCLRIGFEATRPHEKNWRHWLLIFLTLGLGATLIQASLLVPPLLSLFSAAPEGSQNESFKSALFSFITFKFPSLYELFTLHGVYAEHFLGQLRHSLVYIPWQTIRLLFIGLVFSSFLLKPRSSVVHFFGLIVLLSFFFLKGTQFPLSFVNTWLIYHVPLLAVIRNVQYVTFLAVPAYAMLGSIALDALGDELKLLPEQKTRLTLGVLGMVLLLGSPFLGGRLGGSVTPYDFSASTRQAYLDLRQSDQTERVWHFPMHQPMKYQVSDGPNSQLGNSPMIWYSGKIGNWMGVHAPNSPQFHAAVSALFHHGATDSIGSLLARANVGTVLFDRAFHSEFHSHIAAYKHQWFGEMMGNASIERQLNSQQDLALESDDQQVAVFRNRQALPGLISQTNQAILLAGELQDEAALSLVTEGVPAIVLARDLTLERYTALSSYLQAIVLAPGHLPTLTGMLAKGSVRVSPGELLFSTESDANREWVSIYKNQWWWYQPRIGSTEEGMLTLTKASAQLSLPKFTETMRLYAKVFKSETAGQLQFTWSSGTKQLPLYNPDSLGYRYVEIGSITPDDFELKVESLSEADHAIGELLFIPESELAAASAQVEQLLTRLPVIIIGETETNRLSLDNSDQLVAKAIAQSVLLVKPNKGAATTRPVVLSSKGLELEQDIDNNLLADGSFEHGLPSGVRSCDQAVAQPLVASAISEDAQEGSRSIQLTSRRGLACLSVRLPDVTAGEQLRVRFFAKKKAGDNPHFSVVEEGRVIQMAPIGIQEELDRWQRVEYRHTVSPNTTGLSLVLYANSINDQLTEVYFDNLRVDHTNSATNTFVLRPAELVLAPVTPVAFTKHNPTRYTLKRVTAPLLVFREAFHSGWKLDGATMQLPAEGFGQLFIISDGGKERLLTYQPQAVYYVSVIASGVTLGISLLMLLVLKRRQRV